MDFGTLAKTLIFDPLNMKGAEIIDANPAGGLWASLSDLGIYGQWLVQGYNGRPEALAKTLLKQQDFVDLLSPITKSPAEQVLEDPSFKSFNFQKCRMLIHADKTGSCSTGIQKTVAWSQHMHFAVFGSTEAA